MTFTEVATIEFHSSKNCFITVPKSWNIYSNIFKLRALKSQANSDVYVSCNSTNTSLDSIAINGVFAAKIGLNLGDKVLITLMTHCEHIVADCRQCYLKPITENDWEILTLSSAYIESNLLNQIRVLMSGQTFPVWINEGNVCLFVNAFQLIPQSLNVLLLNTFTEVIVSRPQTNIPLNCQTDVNSVPLSDSAKDVRKNLNDNELIDNNIDNSVISSVFTIVKSFLSNDDSNISKEALKSKNTDKSELKTIEIPRKSDFNSVFRVFPLDDNKFKTNLFNTVLISNNYFNSGDNQFFISKLTMVLSPIEKKRESEKTGDKKKESESKSFLKNESSVKETHVIVRPIDNCSESTIYLSDNLRRQMGVVFSSRVLLSSLQFNSIPLIKEITLCPINITPKASKLTSDLLLTDLLELINETSENMVIFCRDSLIKLCAIDFIINTKSDDTVFAITKCSVSDLVIEIGHTSMLTFRPHCHLSLPLSNVSQIDNSLINFNFSEYENFGGYKELLLKCVTFIRLALSLDSLAVHINSLSSVKLNSLLIYGKKGSGKTHLIKTLVKQFTGSPHFVYIHLIDCKGLKGKRIESLQKAWSLALSESLHRQPSILIFEDLDAIASNPAKPEQEDSAESIYTERVSVLFNNLIEKLHNSDISYGNKVAIISTSKSKNSLYTTLMQTRGKRVFHEMYELCPPNLEQIMDIISSIISNKLNDNNFSSHINFNLKDIALKCKACLPNDLSVLIDRAIHNCMLTSKCNSLKKLVLTENNFDTAFHEFSPHSLRGMNLRLISSKKMTDVGGLSSIKKSLRETFLWPIKYPILFSRLPLKPQSSVLLYGAPGTGKTLIVEAIANECSINFISIKGPELLSKYIGASEQSVRDLFSQAETAKPCILFFDEFDALAPRRGHDSTGVTDRVVNQLLTQMDGFEALQTGVYVLAATSRPDLIDPALLRPGRFDKCLHCPLPGLSERLDILRVLSSKLSFSGDIDLATIASQTQNFTGADLQALLYNAQLEALNQSIANNKLSNNQQISRFDSLNNESSEFMTYMPTLENGFSRLLNVAQHKRLIKEVEAIKSSNDSYFANTTHNVNNSDAISSSNEHNSAQTLISIENQHISIALNSTKASINEEERKKYQSIYESFLLNRSQSYGSTEMAKQKVTLA